MLEYIVYELKGKIKRERILKKEIYGFYNAIERLDPESELVAYVNFRKNKINFMKHTMIGLNQSLIEWRSNQKKFEEYYFKKLNILEQELINKSLK